MTAIEVLRYILIVAIGSTIANVLGHVIIHGIEYARVMREVKKFQEEKNSVDKSSEE